MGYMTEINTLLGLPDDFQISTLSVGNTYTIKKNRPRVFPLNLAILMVDSQWNFYGYAVVESSVCKGDKTALEFKVLSLFNPDEQQLYKDKFLSAAKITGELLS